MNILLSNKYFFVKGGAETYLFSLADILEKKGHQIKYFSMHHHKNRQSPDEKYFVSHWDNTDLTLSNIISASAQLLYSLEAKKKISRLLSDFRPDVVHLNNIYHQLSPSIIHSIKKSGVPMVMTLHDFKMVCPVYSLYVNGHICEACKHGRYYNCAINKCVKASAAKSYLGALEMYLHHSLLGIYDLVDIFISPSRFLKNKMLEFGFKGDIVHLPNFVSLEQFIPSYQWESRSVTFFGRLVKNKGILTLIDAVKTIENIELKVIGDGPLHNFIVDKIQTENIKNVKLLGFKNGADLHNEIRDSMFVVVPSEWYENNPLSVIESFALGKPVIGTDIGGIPELVQHNKTGLTFALGDTEDLREKIVALANAPDQIVEMGTNARRFVEDKLDAETYYNGLEKIYRRVMGNPD